MFVFHFCCFARDSRKLFLPQWKVFLRVRAVTSLAVLFAATFINISRRCSRVARGITVHVGSRQSIYNCSTSTRTLLSDGSARAKLFRILANPLWHSRRELLKHEVLLIQLMKQLRALPLRGATMDEHLKKQLLMLISTPPYIAIALPKSHSTKWQKSKLPWIKNDKWSAISSRLL